MGAGKEALNQARKWANGVEDPLISPGWLFMALTVPMSSGAVVSSDPVGGMSGQAWLELDGVRRSLQQIAADDATWATSNYAQCPDEA